MTIQPTEPWPDPPGWNRVECHHDDDARVIFYGGGCECMARFYLFNARGYLYRIQDVATGSYAMSFVPDPAPPRPRRWWQL